MLTEPIESSRERGFRKVVPGIEVPEDEIVRKTMTLVGFPCRTLDLPHAVDGEERVLQAADHVERPRCKAGDYGVEVQVGQHPREIEGEA